MWPSLLWNVHPSPSVVDRVPSVDEDQRWEVKDLGRGYYQIIAHCGFMEKAHVPQLLARAVEKHHLPIALDDATYYLQRETFLATDVGKMGRITETVYAFFARNAADAALHFQVPPEQVVELGTQMDL